MVVTRPAALAGRLHALHWPHRPRRLNQAGDQPGQRRDAAALNLIARRRGLQLEAGTVAGF